MTDTLYRWLVVLLLAGCLLCLIGGDLAWWIGYGRTLHLGG